MDECFKLFETSPKDSGLKGMDLMKYMLSHENIKATCNMLIKMFEERKDLMYMLIEGTLEENIGKTPVESQQ